MAYQGKFSQPRNNADRSAPKAEPRKPEAPAAQPVQPPQSAPAKQAAPAPRTAPAKAAAPVKQTAPVQAEPQRKPNPAQDAPVKKPAAKKRRQKKANRNVTIIFYTVYFVMIAAFFAGMFFVNSWLNDFLVNYEASQPTTKCEEIFLEHFTNPDWSALYTMAGLDDTDYEGADAFADYMDEKLAGGKLSYVETSAGLSGGHKYLLKLGDETLGYFTLVDRAPQGAELPDWQLGEVHVNVSYGKTVLIQTMKGHKVSVNGVELNNEDIIQISTTLAGNYLPGGVSAPTTCIYQVEGLMADPRIVVTDENGEATSVEYSLESGMYIEQTAVNTIGAEEEDVAMAAAETYAKYMIEEANYAQLGKYFDSSSKIYKTITSMTLWMQGHDGYEFANEKVSQYCRYSDDLFSARVALSLNVTRRNGTVKEYTVDTTLFFKHTGSKWLVYDMTNVDVSAPIAEVRLTFKLDDQVLSTNMYENDVPTLTAPMVTPPEGQVFAGWFRQDVDADGSIRYTQVFSPDEDGIISLPNGTKLEPMTLYALFEDAE